jgi:TonB-linked SusC/RagA family outer membrane protein
VSGKSGKVSYLVSGRYYGQDGVYKLGNERFDSYNLRSKISIQATKTLTIDNNSSFSRNDYVQPIFTKGSGSVGTQLHQIAMAGFPVIPPTNEDGSYTIGAAASGYAAFADGNSSQAESRAVFSTTLGATWEPFKDVFKIRADFSYKNVNRDVDRYGASVEYSSAPGTTTHYVKPEDSYKRFFNYKSNYISANVVGTFTPKLGDNHDLNVVAGWNLEDYYYDRLGIVRNGLISNSNPNFELMEGPEVTLVNDGHSYGLVGFFGRANYTLFRRYIFELSARYDGSSKFPVNQQWGFFPSASFGWRISEEPWMSSAKSWLNNLKLRANAGSLGNGGISPFAYLSTMAVTKSGIAFDGALVNKVSDPTVVPDNLTWETVTTYDAGLDLDVLNSRLSFSGDYYIRNTTDLYINGPEIPAVFGETAPKGNYGALQTRGWELTLSWRDSFKLGGKDFTYSVKGSVWDSRTWVTKYYNETGDIYSYYEGKELGEIWGFRTDGLFKTNTEAQNWFKNDYHVYRPASGPYAGDVKFLDVDDNKRISIGDATLNSHGDLERIGNSMPRYQFGLNLDFKWNGIGISAFLQGVGKRDWYPISGSDFFWGGYARAYVAYALKSQSLENTAQVDKVHLIG